MSYFTKLQVPNRRGVVRVVNGGKPPRQKFKIGDRFEEDDSIWRIIYIYRLDNEKGVWFYCLENITTEDELFDKAIEEACCAESVERIMYDAFLTHNEASFYFSSIPGTGDRITRQTKELIKLKKLAL